MTNSSSDSDYDFGKILGIGTNKDNKVVIRNICSTENINNIQELDNNLEKKADSKLVVNENRDPTSSNFTLIENCNNSDLHKKNNKNSQNFKDFVKNKLPNKQLSKGAENNYNLQERISKKLKVISQANQFAWIERLDVTSEKPVLIQNVEDDTERENQFYQQGLHAIIIARKKIIEAGIDFSRPKDYFAEMFKSDIHMQKVRKKLIKERETIELSQKLRKQRELKQFAKAVQQKTLERRAQEKKATLNAISKFRKERKQVFDNNVDFDVAVEKERKNQLKNLQFGEKKKIKQKKVKKKPDIWIGRPKQTEKKQRR
jgi:hypothetical protein